MKLFSVLIGLMLLLTACASPQLVTRDQFMERAYKFDKEHTGQEWTERYRTCYGQYFNYLFNNCRPLVEDGEGPPYWTCCDKALDDFVDCMGEGDL